MISKNANNDNSLLCLDIGTSSIKACVFGESQQIMNINGFSQVHQQTGNIQGGSIINLSQIISNVQETVRKAENSAKKSTKDLVIALSGELVKGMTVSLQYIRTKEKKKIGNQELKSIIYELQWQAFDQIRKHISDELSVPEIELKLVNASIVSINVDNQQVDDPCGHAGKIVTMEIFNCFAPVQHFGQIQNIAVELPYHELKGVFIQSFAICHSLVLKNALESALVIDVGSGTTDLCVVVDGKIIGNRSFSLGGNTLTKRISHELSTSFDEAESIKINYTNNLLDKRSKKVIHEALQSDLDIWASSLDFCLKELPIKKLPGKILLCGQASQIPDFYDALDTHDWEHNFPMEDELLVRKLDYADILEGDFSDEKFTDDFLPLVAVANTAYDLLYNNSSIENILNSIIADKGV